MRTVFVYLLSSSGKLFWSVTFPYYIMQVKIPNLGTVLIYTMHITVLCLSLLA